MVLDEAWNRTTYTSGHTGVHFVHVIAFILGFLNFLFNSFIWITFKRNRKLFDKSHLYLFFAFSVTNCLSGLSSLPTFINLFLHNNLNCPRWTIIIGSGFEIAFDRIRKLLTIAIASERMFAVCNPTKYYLMDHYKFAKFVCIVSLIWAIIDAILMIIEDDLEKIRVHCVTTASSGPMFHIYFLVSSVIFGLIILASYVVFFCKLSTVVETVIQIRNEQRSQAIRDNFRQANSAAIIVVFSVFIFSVVPCALYIYDFIQNEIIFMEIGPVVTVGYHLYGCSGFFIYNWWHKEMRKAIRITADQMFCCNTNNPNATYYASQIRHNVDSLVHNDVVSLQYSQHSIML